MGDTANMSCQSGDELSILVSSPSILVMLLSGPEPKFEPELLRTGPWFGPKFKWIHGPDQVFSPRFKDMKAPANLSEHGPDRTWPSHRHDSFTVPPFIVLLYLSSLYFIHGGTCNLVSSNSLISYSDFSPAPFEILIGGLFLYQSVKHHADIFSSIFIWFM